MCRNELAHMHPVDCESVNTLALTGLLWLLLKFQASLVVLYHQQNLSSNYMPVC